MSEKTIEPPRNVFYDNIGHIECNNEEREDEGTNKLFIHKFTSCKLENKKPTVLLPPIIEISDLQEVIVDSSNVHFFHQEASLTAFPYDRNKSYRCVVGQGLVGRKIECWIMKKGIPEKKEEKQDKEWDPW